MSKVREKKLLEMSAKKKESDEWKRNGTGGFSPPPSLSQSLPLPNCLATPNNVTTKKKGMSTPPKRKRKRKRRKRKKVRGREKAIWTKESGTEETQEKKRKREEEGR
jgi:hypothetical protein